MAIYGLNPVSFYNYYFSIDKDFTLPINLKNLKIYDLKLGTNYFTWTLVEIHWLVFI